MVGVVSPAIARNVYRNERASAIANPAITVGVVCRRGTLMKNVSENTNRHIGRTIIWWARN